VGGGRPKGPGENTITRNRLGGGHKGFSFISQGRSRGELSTADGRGGAEMSTGIKRKAMRKKNPKKPSSPAHSGNKSRIQASQGVVYRRTGLMVVKKKEPALHRIAARPVPSLGSVRAQRFLRNALWVGEGNSRFPGTNKSPGGDSRAPMFGRLKARKTTKKSGQAAAQAFSPGARPGWEYHFPTRAGKGKNFFIVGTEPSPPGGGDTSFPPTRGSRGRWALRVLQTTGGHRCG